MEAELVTPLGVLTVEIDGKLTSFLLTRLQPDEHLFPDVAGRFMIEGDYSLDGKEHSLFEERDGVFRISYCVLEFTATKHFAFGICWIFDCDEDRDSQTWFGADPTLMRKARSENKE